MRHLGKRTFIYLQVANPCTDPSRSPLAPIFEFETEEDVVRMSNDSKSWRALQDCHSANSAESGIRTRGICSFSRDVSRVMRVARALECGMIGVNTGKISAAEAPFGGVKEEIGYGREGSMYGMGDIPEHKERDDWKPACMILGTKASGRNLN